MEVIEGKTVNSSAAVVSPSATGHAGRCSQLLFNVPLAKLHFVDREIQRFMVGTQRPWLFEDRGTLVTSAPGL